MPAPVRDAAMRLAKAYGDMRDRFSRLIAWNGGAACEVANAQGK